MKLKFYLIGFGMGALLATVIIMISGGFGGSEMTDEEIMMRARQLGMVESSSRLSDTTGAGNDNSTDSEGTDSGASVSGESSDDGSEASESASTSASDGDSSSSETEEDTGAASNAGASDDGDTADAAGENTGIIDLSDGDDGEQTAADDTDTSDDTQTSGDLQDTRANSQGGSIIVTVPDGLYSDGVAQLLEEAGAVDDAEAFDYYLVQSGRDRYISPGAKVIPGGATYEEVANVLTGR